jgi:hypothetical protein
VRKGQEGGGGFFVRFINMSQFISPSHIPPLERSIARRQTQNQFTQTQKSEIRGLVVSSSFETNEVSPPSLQGRSRCCNKRRGFPFADFPRGGFIDSLGWVLASRKWTEGGVKEMELRWQSRVRGCQGEASGPFDFME